MTFRPFNNPPNFFSDLIEGLHGAPGLDGSTISLWHPSIGPAGESGKEVIGVPVPLERTIVFSDLAETTRTVSAYDRELASANLTIEDYEGRLERVVVEDLTEANVFSSALIDEDGQRTGFHTIAIDIDHPVRLRETDTPGHYHLMIDVPMPWEQYLGVLSALTEAGVVEEGYYRASEEREATYLRLPWVHKAPKPDKLDILDYDITFVDGQQVLRRKA